MHEWYAVGHVSNRHYLRIVEDACQSILVALGGRNAGTLGDTGAFSLHPLKNINVGSDGGIITTNDDRLASELKRLRNHGLTDHDTVVHMGYNPRLDTIPALVWHWLIPLARN